MSTLKTNNVQVGQSPTASNNFTLYQPSTPDGTVRLGVGNSGATTGDVMTVTGSTSATVFAGSVKSAATGFIFPDNTTQTTAATAAFPAGTKLAFPQASAPTGWTQDTSDTANNRMLRVVNTAGGGVGGSYDPTVMNVVPSHTHGYSGNTGTESAGHYHNVNGSSAGAYTSISTQGNTTGTYIGDPGHSHGVNDPGHAHYDMGTDTANAAGGGLPFQTKIGRAHV